MSDININLDGVIAFVFAVGLGLLLVLGILIISFASLIRARRKREPFSRQSLFPQVVGMLVSLSCCVLVVALLLSSERMPPPRALNTWLDHWLWVWLATVLALWPVSAVAWQKWRRRKL
jgi:sterol desaturase/sphingolipid hydroxylase (fatty acid hydroxylase superfamily)